MMLTSLAEELRSSTNYAWLLGHHRAALGTGYVVLGDLVYLRDRLVVWFGAFALFTRNVGDFAPEPIHVAHLVWDFPSPPLSPTERSTP